MPKKTGRLRSGLLLLSLAALFSVHTTWAQPTEVTSQPVAGGMIDYTEIIDGATDVFMYTPTFQSGGSLGWHMHPGPVFVVVKSGEIAVYAADGCRTTYAAGSGFVMMPSEVMDVRNETSDVVELAATAIVPAGTPRVTPMTAPDAVCSR